MKMELHIESEIAHVDTYRGIWDVQDLPDVPFLSSLPHCI